MAKRKRSKTGDLDLNFNGGKLPSKEEITSKVAKISEDNIPFKRKRIPFTTALTPNNRALLETASHEGSGSVADILNEAIEHYFEHVREIKNTEMKAIFLKIYEAKAK